MKNNDYDDYDNILNEFLEECNKYKEGMQGNITEPIKVDGHVEMTNETPKKVIGVSRNEDLEKALEIFRNLLCIYGVSAIAISVIKNLGPQALPITGFVSLLLSGTLTQMINNEYQNGNQIINNENQKGNQRIKNE